MNEHVYPLLRRTHTAEVRSALCGAAAEQTYSSAGWPSTTANTERHSAI